MTMSIEHTPEHLPSNHEQEPLAIDLIASQAREMTLREGWHVPTLIAVGTTSTIGGAFDEMPDTHGERVRMMYAAGQAMGEDDVVGALRQVVFITEGWLRVVPREEALEQLAEDADRIEVLCVARMTVPDKRHELVLLQMMRDDDGRLVDLPEYQFGDDGADGRTDSPLLKAFVAGYQTARASRAN